MAIYIDAYGNIEVQAPKGTPLEHVLQLLEEKVGLDWAKKSKEIKDRTLGPKEKVYNDGESFLYLGKEYPIQISQDINIKQDHVVFEGDKLHIHVKQLEDEKK
ncbi:hypothetical protein GCM10020331_091200 [Ectobacillus funiculus]